MKKVVACCVTLITTLMLAPDAQAITNGVPDDGGHPNVGALLAPVPYSDGTWETCSGTLIAPTV
ncbi:MAG: trypsin-like serine protease, partial [Actinomycetota bacterium]